MGARGYYVASNIDWDGQYIGYDGRLESAMHADDVIDRMVKRIWQCLC